MALGDTRRHNRRMAAICRRYGVYTFAQVYEHLHEVEGMTAEQIARRFRVAKSTLRLWRLRYNAPPLKHASPHYSGLDNPQSFEYAVHRAGYENVADYCAWAAQEGLTRKQAAQRLGFGPWAIGAAIRRNHAQGTFCKWTDERRAKKAADMRRQIAEGKMAKRTNTWRKFPAFLK